MKLYNFWRSSASYRVRIALHHKGLPFEYQSVDLLGTAEHLGPGFRAENPQSLLPFLVDGPVALGQSLAILEYLEEKYPARSLLPAAAADRARSRSLAQFIAAEIQPINTLRIGKYLQDSLGVDELRVRAWRTHWMTVGFDALEASVRGGPFLGGDLPSVADACLVPQVWYASVFGMSLEPWPRLREIDARCRELPAFAAAHPGVQPDAPRP